MPHIPLKYLPPRLTRKDRKQQYQQLLLLAESLPQGSYVTRRKVASYPHRPSRHLYTLQHMYGVKNGAPTPALAQATGCSIAAMKQIVRKGEGAYYSVGVASQPNGPVVGHCPARELLDGGKSAAVDYRILEAGCDPKKRAMRLRAPIPPRTWVRPAPGAAGQERARCPINTHEIH
jgi:hypothetical protein